VPQWKVIDGHHISRGFKFPDFVQALAFVNKVGAIAE
jgi:pterin-4a-carbinolamine dehydratase